MPISPQQFADAKGELQGLNVELMREIAKRLCIPLDLIRMDFPPMVPALTAGRFDGIDTGIFWTEERSKIAYTVPRAGEVESAILIDQTAREIERRGLIEITATGLGGAPTTMMFRNKTVATKVAATLTEMGDDGTYGKLVDKFGLTKAPSETFAIRGPDPQ